MVEDQVVDRALVRLDCARDLVSLHVDELDFTVGATDSDLLARLVEFDTVGDRVASVQIAHLLHHSDIPDLHDTIRVARTDVLTSDRESAVVDRVQVTEKSLHGQTRPHIPNGDRSVGATTDEEVGKWLEVEAIDAVSVLTVLLSHLERVEIEKLHRAVL